MSYGRDAIGRVDRKTETMQAQTTYYAYEYDLAGHLDKVYEGSSAPCGAPPTANCTLAADYAYDANGNRNPSACIYDLQDRLTSCGTTSYLYTDWGALKEKTVSSAVTTYEYDMLGRLRKVSPPPPLLAIEYIIDGLGRRVGRKVNGALDRVWARKKNKRPLIGSPSVTAGGDPAFEASENSRRSATRGALTGCSSRESGVPEGKEVARTHVGLDDADGARMRALAIRTSAAAAARNARANGGAAHGS